MSKIVIRNNEARQRRIQLPATKGPTKQGAIRLGPILFLSPGANLVDEALWRKAKENPNVLKLLTLRIEPSPAPEHNQEKTGWPMLEEGPVVSDDRPLDKLKPVEALHLIEETFDQRLLEQWLHDEKRPAVQKAISGQLDQLNRRPDPQVVTANQHGGGGGQTTIPVE